MCLLFLKLNKTDKGVILEQAVQVSIALTWRQETIQERGSNKLASFSI